MCCGTPEAHQAGERCAPHPGGRHYAGACACGGPAHFGRRFVTREEKIAWLERYRESLQQETQAVEERIAALQEEK